MSAANRGIRTSVTTQAFAAAFETLYARQQGGVLFAEIAAPPMNLLGPELVRGLVSCASRRASLRSSVSSSRRSVSSPAAALPSTSRA